MEPKKEVRGEFVLEGFGDDDDDFSGEEEDDGLEQEEEGEVVVARSDEGSEEVESTEGGAAGAGGSGRSASDGMGKWCVSISAMMREAEAKLLLISHTLGPASSSLEKQFISPLKS